jgi:hypothetical protein
MRFTRARLLGMTLAASVVATAGCDDVSAGQLTDPDGPVRLVRVMVQDAPASVDQIRGEGGTTRGGAVDLLDKSPGVECSDNTPCQVLMAYQGGLADYTCRKGVCNDPLKVPRTGVPFNPDIPGEEAMPAMPPMPAMGCTPATGPTEPTEAIPPVPGMSVRIVFNKLLDPAKITSDGTTLLPGIVELIDDGSGTTIPFDTLNAIWEPSGAPEFTSDPILSPFGPAIQISPLALTHNRKYTVIIHPALIQDRSGNPLGDQDGNPVSGDLKYSFITENVSANLTLGSFKSVSPYQLPGDFTPVFGTPPTIYATDVLQLAFTANMELETFQFTLIGPNGPVTTAEKYYESPRDPETNTCPEETTTNLQINLYNTTGKLGDPAPWPVGTYQLSFTVSSWEDDTSVFRSSDWPGADAAGVLTFTVVEPPPDNGPDVDASIIDLHPLPEQCPCL